MFKHASKIDLTAFCPLLIAFFRSPLRIMRFSAFCLKILKIRNFFQQNFEISGLVHIKLCCNKRPERMVHPDSCDVISVRNEFTRSVSYDRCIGTVHTHTTVIRKDHLPHQ